jgi:pantothenate kinase-related protein Tda10
MVLWCVVSHNIRSQFVVSANVLALQTQECRGWSNTLNKKLFEMKELLNE